MAGSYLAHRTERSAGAASIGSRQVMEPPRIPFNKPSLEGNELEYMRDAAEAGNVSASGPYADRVCELLRRHHDAGDVLLTTSGTGALELAALMLDLQPGDTVVVPSFTYVTSALAFVRAGARILFVDIEPETLGVDPAHLAHVIDESVRAVVAVHYGGIGCDITGICDVLDAHPAIDLIEDNAAGLFGAHRHRPLGSIGRFGAVSFHQTKTFVAGQGGALVINRDADVARARVLHDNGTDRYAFLHNEVDAYSWHDVGSSFGLSEILAGYLLGQLEARAEILRKRRATFDRYHELLQPHAADHGFTLPGVPDDRTNPYHVFYILAPDEGTRDRAIKAMAVAGVQATFHYLPLHSSVGGRRYRVCATECPVTDDVSSRMLRLPFYNDLGEEDTQRVVDALLAALS